MSKQSDIEMLSIRAMETYSKRNHISGSEAVEIFHEYKVFENIMIQHEFLHQVDFEEVMGFVNQLIEEEKKEIYVFHGTVAVFDKINLNKSHNRRDFGVGFYTTVLEEQAKEWAYRQSLRQHEKKYYVYMYCFNEINTLNIKHFDSLNREWLEFITTNRSQGGLHHSYDVVIGPVADDDTMETVQLYTAGILKVNEALERLKYNKVNNQVSFHTKNALESIKLVRRDCYE